MSEQLLLDDENVSITLRRAWDLALRQLAARVNKPTFETHIRSIRPLSLSELPAILPALPRGAIEILLGVPSAFTREWIEKRHATLIAQVLEEIFDREVRVKFALAPRETGAAPSGAGSGAGQGSGTAIGGSRVPVGASASNATGETIFAGAESSDLAVITAPTTSTAPRREIAAPPTTVASRRAANAASREAASSHQASLNAGSLNPRYTFDSFIVGASNRLAQAGAQAVAQEPGSVYNPLFIYGPPGLGKTHLMQAIGNEIIRQRGESGLRVSYVSGEEFTTGFITSLREQRATEFRRRSCAVDVWLMDDIQFIAGKESTKEEFFHTFNALYQNGKQIVISSDRSPRELRAMDERLRSRFEAGLVADITPPDLETRLAILHRKAEFERMRIPDDVLLYMARLVRSNIRTLEGALVKLIAYSSLINAPITTELATSVLERYYLAASEESDALAAAAASVAEARRNGEAEGDDAANLTTNGFGRSAARTFAAVAGLGPAGTSITPELVQRIVAKRFGMNADALSGKKRDREIVMARQIAMHLVRELTEMSMPSIGERFGGRDHSTVAYSCDKVRNQMPIDEELRKTVEDLMLQVKAQAP